MFPGLQFFWKKVSELFHQSIPHCIHFRPSYCQCAVTAFVSRDQLDVNYSKLQHSSPFMTENGNGLISSWSWAAMNLFHLLTQLYFLSGFAKVLALVHKSSRNKIGKHNECWGIFQSMRNYSKTTWWRFLALHNFLRSSVIKCTKSIKIDKRFFCIWQRWHRAFGVEGHFFPGTNFGLILAASDRGSVHIGRRNFAAFMISRNDPRVKNLFVFVRKEVPGNPKCFKLTGSSLSVLKSFDLEGEDWFYQRTCFWYVKID